MTARRSTRGRVLASEPLRCGLIASLLLLTGDPDCGGAQPLVDEFSTWCQARLPSRGSVHATFEDVGSGRKGLFGYDAATQSWYGCFHGKVFGRQPDGTMYRNQEPYTSVARWEGSRLDLSDHTVDGAFPTVILYDIASRADQAESIELDPQGGWKVSFLFPMGSRTVREESFKGDYRPPDKRVIYHVDAHARLVAIEHENSIERIEYSPLSLPLPVATRFGGGPGWKLLAAEGSAEGSPREFDMEEVVELATSAGVLDDTIRWAQPDGAVSRSSEPPEGVPELPAPKRPPRMNLPLVGAGILFIGVGVYAWARRR